MSTDVSHPLFARLYPRIAAEAERRGAEEHRRRLLASLTGRVIEVGAGNGLNFIHYPDTVSELLAVEPEPRLRELASEAAASARVPTTVVDVVADDLPADHAAFDAGVASLVLCSVPEQLHALVELRRVIRSGGGL